MKLSWLKDYNLLIFDQIDSTNSEAIRLAKAGITGNFVIWSDKQTDGRGQRSRKWESLEGNLHMSILLECAEDLEFRRLPQLSFLAANALYETILFFTLKQKLKLDIALKWPNDVLINHKKVAGILLESVSFAGRRYAVAGIGVNIISYPKNLSRSVTSLAEERIYSGSSDEFLNILMIKFDKLYKKWLRSGDFTKVREDWLGRAYNLYKVITVDNGLQRMSGIFKTIDMDGSIMLELASGEVCNLSSGEIIAND